MLKMQQNWQRFLKNSSNYEQKLSEIWKVRETDTKIT